MNEQIIMHLDNLAEEEREQFTKLLEKQTRKIVCGNLKNRPILLHKRFYRCMYRYLARSRC